MSRPFGRLSPILSLTVVVLATACARQQNQVQNPANAAAPAITSSFSVMVPDASDAPAPTLNVDRAKVRIEKSALEKEFLLQASLIPQQMAPMFHGQKSRIVFFRQVDKKVYMIEASKGLLIARDYPQTLLLAEFPVLEETGTTVTFDFNAGMSRLFSAGDWQTRDFGGSSGAYTSLKAVISYIESATFTGDNSFEIHQTALLDVPTVSGRAVNLPVKVVYYLKPYTPNPAFVPTRAPRNLDRMGFFEVQSQFNDESGEVAYASKRDISKPIVFAISANTPKDYKDAVRDGILYWNKAFGKDVVKVVDGPANSTAPNADYNIVQWADWDSAGFAYADAQMDPRTGEILHQQIYFTSAWALYGRGEIQKYLRKQPAQPTISLLGFGSSQLCDRDINDVVARELSNIVSLEKDPAKILKASQDLIREVVAHEVGHTMGLRHNFAGSLSANYSVDERDALFKDYFNSGTAKPDLVTSSSVMDYQFPMEAMMNGDQMAKGDHAAAYDTKAIQALYFGKQYKASDLPLFCTDSAVGEYLDCMPYDAGNSYVAWIRYSGRMALNSLPNTLVERYIHAKVPMFGAEQLDVADVELDPKMDAVFSIVREPDFLSLLTKEGKLLSVERKYPYVSSANSAEVRAKTIELVDTDLARNGGFEKVLINASENSADGLYAKFEALLADPKVIRGEGPTGKTYEFSADELVVMKENAKRFFDRLSLELVKTEVKFLAGDSLMSMFEESPVRSAPKAPAKKFDSTHLAEEFASYLEKRVSHYVLSTSGEPTIFARNATSDWTVTRGRSTGRVPEARTEATTLTLPHFSYPFEVRKKAASLLAASRAENPGWAYGERWAVQKSYKKMVSAALPGVTAKDPATLENYPQDVINWILESQSLESDLGVTSAGPVALPGQAGATTPQP